MEIKANSWYRTRGGDIAYVFGINPYPTEGEESVWASYKSGFVNCWFPDGTYIGGELENNDLIEHLPDCDDFDWVPAPKILIEAGKKYVLANGDVVGPMELNGSPIGYCWSSRTQPLCAWNNDGLCSFKYKTEYNNIVAEYIEPEPTYEPFANAAEFAPYCEKWIKRNDANGAWRVTGYDDFGVWCSNSLRYLYKELFQWQFIDGKPCGRVKQ